MKESIHLHAEAPSVVASVSARILIATLAVIASCAAKRPETTIVGSSVETATARLGVTTSSWESAATTGYEVSCDRDRSVRLWGHDGTVCLIRRGDTVAALSFHVADCTGANYDELRAAVIASFGLDKSESRDVYVVGRRGVVHLRPTSDGSAELVVTDVTYGEVYVNEQLRDGFVDLSNGLRPH